MAGQTLHIMEPETSEYMPGRQVRHCVWPAIGWYVPAWQSTQWPSLLMVPGGQSCFGAGAGVGMGRPPIISQFMPTKPTWHMQLYLDRAIASQTPPFWHGLAAHAFPLGMLLLSRVHAVLPVAEVVPCAQRVQDVEPV